MAKKTVKFVCQSCGYESPKWMGKCPQCNQWNQMVEEVELPKPKGVFFYIVLQEVKPKQHLLRI